MANRLPLLLLIILLAAAPVFAQRGDGVPSPDGGATAEPAPSTGVITGSVSNRTPGSVVPDSGEPMLHVWDAAFQEKGMEHGQLLDGAVFRFENVPFVPGYQYAVMLNYQGVTYYSEPATIGDGQEELALEVPIFETTTSTDAVRISRQHIFFDASAEDELLVGEIFVLSNDGERTVVAPADADPAAAPLAFVLPKGAQNISLENNSNGRFKPTEAGFADTSPLRPGEGAAEIVVRYNLPYEDALTYTFTAPWPVDGLNVLLPDGSGLTLRGDGLQQLETREMGSGGQVVVYNHEGLTTGETLSLNLSGELKAPPGPTAVAATTDAPMPAGADRSLPALITGGLGLFLLVLAVWVYRGAHAETPSATSSQPVTFDALVAEIALLDEAHEGGRIDETDYSRRRSLLFARAQELMPEG